uniref:Uncharacterized protein n=1 Tax=Arcella intermedia TaxID=1963864 RepID=A0A6B2LUL9_9EUKA
MLLKCYLKMNLTQQKQMCILMVLFYGKLSIMPPILTPTNMN